METLTVALIAGLAFAVIDMLFMLPHKGPFPGTKKEAMVAVFLQRFGTGFAIPFVTLPIHHALTGALIALLFSLPLYLFLKVKPALMGTLIGFIIGWFS
jgi:hypothetical protein